MKSVFALLLALLLTSCTSNKNAIDATADSTSGYRDFLPGVKIVYSGNMNGEIEPCGCRGSPTGGIQRRWNVQAAHAQGERLMLDSGDLFYKSHPVPPFLEKQWNYQAEVLLKAYNAYGIEALAPGELDFAAGLEQFEKLRAAAQFKIVSANIYLQDGSRFLEPYAIFTKNGKKIGVFGLFDEALPLPSQLTAKPHIEAAREIVGELKKKVDVVIALTHIGLDKDQELARQVEDIDAIFGAHTQSFLIKPEKVGDTLIFQTSFRGQHLGIYANGQNGLHQIDTRYESKATELNPMDKLLAEAKQEIARINSEMEEELMGKPAEPKQKLVAEYQTFARCIECHATQYDFHKDTQHFRAFQTLVKANQAGNLECLKCHTAGAQQAGGWKHVSELVKNASGKSITAEAFAKSLPKANSASLTKISKAFINVQCENCHGPAGNHPFSGTYSKQVSAATCLNCHTPERAPGWHKNGKPDMELIKAKIKALSCPK